MPQKTRVRTSLLSIGVSLWVLGLKAAAYLMTGSTALKSDALESVVNVLAAGFALGAILWAHRPADRDHPYGHGKIEFVSAAFEGGLITLAALFIVGEAAAALWLGPQLKDLGTGLVLSSVAGLCNGLLGWRLLKVGRATRSKALEADGHHVLSDFWTTVGLLAGLLIVKATGLVWLDPLLALLVGLLLARTGLRLLKESSDALMDREDRPLLEALLAAVNRWEMDGVISLHKLRAMRAGSYTHVDIHVIVPEYWDVLRSHGLGHAYEEHLLQACKIQGEFHTHIEPCRRAYCSVCPDAECPIRQAPFEARRSLSLAQAVSPQESPP